MAELAGVGANGVYGLGTSKQGKGDLQYGELPWSRK